MGKRYSWIGFLIIFLLSASLCGAAAGRAITHVQTVRDGFDELLVTTSFANYVFSEDGGTLRSVLLTFTPFGTSIAELVAGTTTNAETLRRAYLTNIEFPFDIMHADDVFEYTLAEPVYTDTGAIIVELHGEGGGISVVKRFTIEPDAMYTLTVEVEITTGETLAEPLRMVFSNFIPTDKGRQLTYLFDDNPGTAQLAPGSYFQFDGLGLMDDAVVFFLSPDEATPTVPFAELTDAGNRRVGVKLSASAGTTTYRFSLYGGRRRFMTMEAAGIEALDQTGLVAQAMVQVIRLLNWLYRHTGNYGWAIILFTLMMRIVLYPLMRKQFRSMARMQQIQPRIKRIQTRYKDNREELQRKTIEIYRKEKVNPMSGCLPMIVQLPIIVIIWRALLYASEQIHLSPSFLWLPDLSMPDPYFILIIVTTIIMLLQQHFMSPMGTTDAAGPQKYVGYFFPVMMSVMLWRFPSGLWLYYMLTTGAQVGQQAFVNWEMKRDGIGQPPVPIDEPIDVDESTTESDDNGDTT